MDPAWIIGCSSSLSGMVRYVFAFPEPASAHFAAGECPFKLMWFGRGARIYRLGVGVPRGKFDVADSCLRFPACSRRAIISWLAVCLGVAACRIAWPPYLDSRVRVPTKQLASGLCSVGFLFAPYMVWKADDSLDHLFRSVGSVHGEGAREIGHDARAAKGFVHTNNGYFRFLGRFAVALARHSATWASSVKSADDLGFQHAFLGIFLVSGIGFNGVVAVLRMFQGIAL